MKVLIAGGSGFIGSEIAARFAEDKSNKIFVLTRNPQKARLYLPYENVEFWDLNRGWKYLRGLILNIEPEVVVNAVGILYEEGSQTYQKVHVDFLKDLLKALEGLNLNRFVQISSCGVGRYRGSEYFRTKELAEKLVEASEFDYTIFRPSIVVGRRQLLFRQLERIAKFSPFIVVPKIKVQPVNVKDLAEAVYSSVESEEFKNRKCEIGGPKILSMGEFVKMALQYLKIKKPVIELPWWAFIPALPLMELLKLGNWETLKMARHDNVCPDNCLFKLVPQPRELFEF